MRMQLRQGQSCVEYKARVRCINNSALTVTFGVSLFQTPLGQLEVSRLKGCPHFRVVYKYTSCTHFSWDYDQCPN